MIFGTALKHRYKRAKSDALAGVDIKITPGEFVAVCGANGSGKSTLARHLNALMMPTEGTLFVDGHETSDVAKLLDIHKACGMVFQNPDNQIVSAVVEEDVAFGPENVGVPTAEMQELVDSSLERVGLLSEKLRSTAELSGGQKQRLAIAGVLAMMPKCIVLDEPTAMLDPAGRREVMSTLRSLHEQGITIVLITHHMDEVLQAQRVIVMFGGKIVRDCTPAELFASANVSETQDASGSSSVSDISVSDQLLQYGLDAPRHSALADLLEKLIESPSEAEYFAEDQNSDPTDAAHTAAPEVAAHHTDASENQKLSITLNNVFYSYNAGTPSEVSALNNIDLVFPEGCFTALIGKTGSGKSTLIKMLNALMRPTSGTVDWNGFNDPTGRDLTRFIRSEVGMVFQYPENQLFAQTVLEDVCYGIKNFAPHLSPDETRGMAADALHKVGIPEKLFDRSPFELSGGEKRRAAIAGVLALKPAFLVLDEPTAGLDPEGSRQLLQMLDELHADGTGIILVSHDMNHVAEHAKHVILMDHGSIVLDADMDILNSRFCSSTSSNSDENTRNSTSNHSENTPFEKEVMS